jgi:SPP1 gp7 family putative phage head morphogenesis protein
VRDWLLRNSHHTHRFENNVIREMMRHYAVARDEIMTAIRHGTEGWGGYTRGFRLDRLKGMVSEIESAMEFANVGATSTLDESLKAFGITQAEGLGGEMTRHFPPHLGIGLIDVPLSHVFEIVGEPMLGETFGERMLWNNQQNVRKIRDRLTQSVIQGEDMGQASRRLFGSGKWMTGVIGKDARMRAEMIARTEIQRVSNAVTRKIYEENQDVVKGIQYIATLDRRTCIICGSDDGQVWYYNKDIANAPTVPRHPRCRCTYSPVTKSWKELGINRSELPPGTRASMDGQVLDVITYGQWFKTQPTSFQLDHLGPTRYRLWKQGKLELGQMVESNRILNIDQLADRMGATARALKIEPGKQVTALQNLTVKLRSTALVSEPETTSALVGVAEAQGAQMQGLPFRIKTSKSTLRKFNKELRDNPKWSVADIEKYDANDILRYTMLAEEAKYTETVAKAFQELVSKGHKVEKIKNYWLTPADRAYYRGINVVMRNNKGIKYELQFHTPQTKKTVMDVTHPIYEKVRQAAKLGLSESEVDDKCMG